MTVVGLPDDPGYAAKVFRAVADADVNIDMVLQNISKIEDGKTDITFTCSRDSGPGRGGEAGLAAGRNRLQPSALRRSHRQGVADRRRACAAIPASPRRSARRWPQVGVNIDLISTSEIRISVLCQGHRTGQGRRRAARGIRPRRRRGGHGVCGDGTLDMGANRVSIGVVGATGQVGQVMRSAARRARLPGDQRAVLRLGAFAGPQAAVPRPGDRGRGRRDRRPDRSGHRAVLRGRDDVAGPGAAVRRRRGDGDRQLVGMAQGRRRAAGGLRGQLRPDVDARRGSRRASSPTRTAPRWPRCRCSRCCTTRRSWCAWSCRAIRPCPAAAWPAWRSWPTRPAPSSTTPSSWCTTAARWSSRRRKLRRADRVQRRSAGRQAGRRRLRRDRRRPEAAQREPQDPRHSRPAGQRHLRAGPGVHRALAVDQRRVRPTAFARSGPASCSPARPG